MVMRRPRADPPDVGGEPAAFADHAQPHAVRRQLGDFAAHVMAQQAGQLDDLAGRPDANSRC